MTAPASFRTLRKFLAAKWLVKGEGELVGYSLDLIKDAFAERIRLGLYAQMPQNDPDGTTTAPPDALAAMGRDRRVVRGIGESDQSYARRQVLWLVDRKTTGNPFTLMKKLSEYLGPLPSFRTVDARGNWFSRSAAGDETYLLNQGNWNWDGDLSGRRWSRFWVIVYPNGLWTEGPGWGDVDAPAWGDSPSSTWGSTATPEQVDTVRALVKEWKPAGTRCVNTIIAFDPASFNPASPEPDGTWGTWAKTVDGVSVPSRLSTARYWDGTATT